MTYVYLPGLRSAPVMVGLIIFGVMLVACGGNTQPQIVIQEPSATVTLAPEPTDTRVPGFVVATATSVSTHKPSTPTPGASPTSLLAPTQSLVPMTPTAIFVPVQTWLSVDYFTTDSVSVKPGENVTLFWAVEGASRVHIYRVDAAGERVWRWDVNTTGTLTVRTRAGDRTVARFLLTAESADDSVEQPLFIPMQCPEVWFFDPAPEACPAAPLQISTQAEQLFERGRMLWVETQDRIYVIFEDGKTPAWAQYPDDFESGIPDMDETLVAPPGLQQPIRGFGLVWRSNPRVQDRLGWATTPEVSFEGMYQADALETSVATLYLRTRAGEILVLNSRNDQWTMLLR